MTNASDLLFEVEAILMMNWYKAAVENLLNDGIWRRSEEKTDIYDIAWLKFWVRP